MMIEAYANGKSMHIGGKVYHNDLKIINGQVHGDWWRKEGHRLDAADIEDILEARPRILVIGTGYAEGMQVPEDTREALLIRDIQVVAQKTGEAVKTYNRLCREGRPVSGAFHLTC
jgi:hypothetical protein